jgi:hypothetical protein
LLIEERRPDAPINNHQLSISNETRRRNLMCPACVASAALMAGSVMSTGGIAALAVKVVRGIQGGQKENSKHTTERRDENGSHDDEQNGIGHGGAAS